MKEGFSTDGGANRYQMNKGRSGGNISVAISDQTVHICDNNTGVFHTYKSNIESKLYIYTSKGRDTIHIKTDHPLTKPFIVSVETCGSGKLVTSVYDPLLKVNLHPLRNVDLFIPAADASSYEHHISSIKKWNEDNRKADGFIKRIKRKIVYFFGRDLKLRKPSAYWEEIKTTLFENNRKKDKSIYIKPYYSTSESDLRMLESLAMPADILLRYQEGYPLDKYFVGTWQHAAIYYRNGKLIDAMGNGTYMRTLTQFGEADGILLLRINGISPVEADKALTYAFEQVGKSYSVDFDDCTDEEYCSGLIIHALQFAGVLSKHQFKGHSVKPDDLLRLDRIQVIWTNRTDLLQISLRA